MAANATIGATSMIGGDDRRLAAAIAQIGELPVLDRTVQRVLVLCRDEDSSTNDLVAALEGDASFAANLLRFANSAHAARPVRVRTIRQAVMLAGRDTIGRLAVEAATCRFLERAHGNGRASVGLMHVHASAVASCALEVAHRTGAAADVAHLAGLLHDIGKLVMPIAFGEDVLDDIAAAAPAGPARVALERQRLACDHAVAGAMLAAASAVDAPVIAAICGHHEPDPNAAPETACVQVANAVVGMLMGVDPDPDLLDSALTLLSLDAAALDDIAIYAGQLGAGQPAAAPSGGSLSARIAELEQQANTDELTGLPNRRRWNQLARELIEPHCSAVMLCDVDNFKRVNDRNGHATGDLVLSEVARILARHGLAGRLGGDELVLLASASRPDAEVLARLIIEQIRNAFPPGEIEGWDRGVSIGIAIATAEQHDLTALLKAADEALYEAKRAGRGRAALA